MAEEGLARFPATFSDGMGHSGSVPIACSRSGAALCLTWMGRLAEAARRARPLPPPRRGGRHRRMTGAAMHLLRRPKPTITPTTRSGHSASARQLEEISRSTAASLRRWSP